jgi:hypothetical protein
MRPKARTKDLIIETLPNETLVYDERSDKAHCLNSTAALIWRMADGDHSVDDIARAVGVAGAKEIVTATLDDLRKAKLLEDNDGRADRGISRRELGRRIAAGAAFALPAILTIGVPTAASAASCLPAGGCCNVKSDCCAGLNCTNKITACGSGKECTLP